MLDLRVPAMARRARGVGRPRAGTRSPAPGEERRRRRGARSAAPNPGLASRSAAAPTSSTTTTFCIRWSSRPRFARRSSRSSYTSVSGSDSRSIRCQGVAAPLCSFPICCGLTVARSSSKRKSPARSSHSGRDGKTISVHCPASSAMRYVARSVGWRTPAVARSTSARLRRASTSSEVSRSSSNSRDTPPQTSGLFGLRARKRFVQTAARKLAPDDHVRMHTLWLGDTPIAAALGFVQRDTWYAYNASYHRDHRVLSPGFVCHALGIRGAIREGMIQFDFLRGAESYKYRLRARDRPLRALRVRRSTGDPR